MSIIQEWGRKAYFKIKIFIKFLRRQRKKKRRPSGRKLKKRERKEKRPSGRSRIRNKNIYYIYAPQKSFI